MHSYFTDSQLLLPSLHDLLNTRQQVSLLLHHHFAHAALLPVRNMSCDRRAPGLPKYAACDKAQVFGSCRAPVLSCFDSLPPDLLYFIVTVSSFLIRPGLPTHPAAKKLMHAGPVTGSLHRCLLLKDVPLFRSAVRTLYLLHR